MHVFCLDRPDSRHTFYRVYVRGNQMVNGVKPIREKARGPLTYVRDTECKDEPLQRTLLAHLDRSTQVVDTGFSQALQLCDRFPVQRIDVAEVLDHSQINESVCKLFTEALDIHPAARYEVMDVALELRWTSGVRAKSDCFAFSAVSRRAADRAKLWHNEFQLVSSSPLGDDLDDLRDDIAGALNDNAIADANVFAPDLVLVVESRSTD